MEYLNFHHGSKSYLITHASKLVEPTWPFGSRFPIWQAATTHPQVAHFISCTTSEPVQATPSEKGSVQFIIYHDIP